MVFHGALKSLTKTYFVLIAASLAHLDFSCLSYSAVVLAAQEELLGRCGSLVLKTGDDID
jgi:hypothetical protein